MRRYTLLKFPACAARTFGKVDYSDNQSLLGYTMYGRFANAHINKTFRTVLLSSKIFLHFTILFLPLHRRKIDTIKLSTSLFHTEEAFLKYEQSLVRTY